jgi:hypothetical protein
MTTLTDGQLEKIRRTYADLTAVLSAAGVIEPGPPTPEPRWRADYARMWRLLNAVEQADGDLGADEWSRLGLAHDYDPRGLGGYFRGAEPMMATQGARRVLTDHGRKFIQRWQSEFGEIGQRTAARERSSRVTSDRTPPDLDRRDL